MEAKSLIQKKFSKYATPKLLKMLETSMEEELEVVKEILSKRGVEFEEDQPERKPEITDEQIAQVEEKITAIIEENNKQFNKELLDALGGVEEYSLLTDQQVAKVLAIGKAKPEKKEKKVVKPETKKKVAEAVKKQVPAPVNLKLDEMVDAIYKMEIPHLSKMVLSFLGDDTYDYDELPEENKALLYEFYDLVTKTKNVKERVEKFLAFAKSYKISEEIQLFSRVNFVAAGNSKTPKKELNGWATSVFYDNSDKAIYYYILGDNGIKYCKKFNKVKLA